MEFMISLVDSMVSAKWLLIPFMTEDPWDCYARISIIRAPISGIMQNFGYKEKESF